MFTALYNRIETRAGGSHASPRAFIRAFRGMITDQAKTRANRGARHNTIRSMLEKREQSISLYSRVMRGGV